MNALEKAIYDYHNTNKTIALILQETGIMWSEVQKKNHKNLLHRV